MLRYMGGDPAPPDVCGDRGPGRRRLSTRKPDDTFDEESSRATHAMEPMRKREPVSSRKNLQQVTST